MLLNKIVLNAYKNYKAFNKNEKHNIIILRYFNRDFLELLVINMNDSTNNRN